MKINSEILEKFVRRTGINASGDSFDIRECVFNFDEDGVNVVVVNESNTIMVKSFLNKKSFLEYEQLGAVAVHDLNILTKMINRCSGDLEMKKEDNLLTLKVDKRNFDFILPHPDVVAKQTKLPELQYETTLKIDSSFLKDAIKSADIIGYGTLIFAGKEDKLIIVSGEDNKAREVLNVPMLQEEIKVLFGEPMKNVVGVLNGEVDIGLKSSYPATIEMTDDKMKFKFIIAPREE